MLAGIYARSKAHLDTRFNSLSAKIQEILENQFLDALLPGTVVPVHRHESTAETVVCLRGRLWEVIYEEVPEAAGTSDGPVFREVSRHLLCPAEGCQQVPAGAGHTIEVLEPLIIFEAKDGAYMG